MIMQLNHGAEDTLAEGGDAPTSGTWDLGQQTSDVKSLQQARRAIRLPSPLRAMFSA